MEEVVIIGGGIAGLSCLNALLDQKIPALLLEASQIGTPKLCGEFIAPVAVRILKNWNIPNIHLINATEFTVAKKNFILPLEAGACSRSQVEIQLAQRARNLGGIILENTPINAINSSSPFELQLGNQIIKSKKIIFAAGKFNQKPKEFPYKGFKFHFPHRQISNRLKMFSFKDLYFGTIPISSTLSNCVGLMRKSLLNSNQTCRDYFSKLIESHHLNDEVQVDQNFFETEIPEFKIKHNSKMENAEWIGDAYASFHPAIGYGFANSIITAVNVAYNIPNKNPKPIFKVGKLMHHIYMNPLLGKSLIPFVERNSWLPNYFLKKLNYR